MSPLFGYRMSELMFSMSFVLILGVFVMILVRGIREWDKNNHSPRLTVPAQVVSRRTHVSRRGANGHRHTSTSYYITFQVDSGDRMELRVDGREYGMLLEGDRGDLSFQGTRYLGFERQ